MNFKVNGSPHEWPKADRKLIECALIIIDMQNDFCTTGFYMDKAGYDVERLRKPIEPIRSLLLKAREKGLLIIHTRHGRKNNGIQNVNNSCLPLTSTNGDDGWQIISELTPLPNEKIIEKITCSAFISGELHHFLQSKTISSVAFCGNTIDVCVHSTLRSANDLGYDCLLLEDCCGAVNDNLFNWSIESVQVESGVFGTISNSKLLIKALDTQ